MLGLLRLTSYSQATLQAITDNEYRAAKYSVTIDFHKAAQIMPDIQYDFPDLTTVSYLYYIQYGPETFIEIFDPGPEMKYFSGAIKKWNYLKRELMFITILDHVKSYSMSKDSITYSIDESSGKVTELCDEVELNARCDSVIFISNATKSEFKIVFKDTIANFPFRNLFYPDIQFLPYKIFSPGQSKSVKTFEEIINGKPAIDSILQLFNFEGYAELNDEDITPADRQSVIDLLEKLKCVEEED